MRVASAWGLSHTEHSNVSKLLTHADILALALPIPECHGRFHIQNVETGEHQYVDNIITTEGAQAFLKMMFQAYNTDVSAGGNFYLGICGASVAFADTLASIVTEPSGTGGYARIAITRDGTGFPTIATVNGIWRALSKSITWTASVSAYDHNLVRVFLCNVASGTSGKLFAYSGALASAIPIVAGASYQATYEFYLN